MSTKHTSEQQPVLWYNDTMVTPVNLRSLGKTDHAHNVGLYLYLNSLNVENWNSKALKWSCFNQVYHQKPHAINIIRSWYRELRGWEEALAPVNETRDLVPGCSNISTVPRGQASLQRPSVNGFIALWLIGGKYQNLTMLVSGRNSEVNFQKVHEFFIDRRF